MRFNRHLVASSTALSRRLHYLRVKLMLQTTLTALVTLLLERLQNDIATAHGCSGSFVSFLHLKASNSLTLTMKSLDD
jgi:hypothetical protein